VECIENGTRPITDGYAGLRVVRILEAATRSMKQRGRLVELASLEETKATLANEVIAGARSQKEDLWNSAE